jgi:hypothetical protein
MSLTPQPSRKRDRLRSIFGRSPSPFPVNRTAGPARTPSPNHAKTSVGNGILSDVLQALGPDDRRTVSTLLLPKGADNIDAVFNDVHSYARKLQERCATKRWSWEYKGRQVYLSDQVDKIMPLLDKFKSAGDVVANVDPVHIGLPWAGIRVILEVCIYRRITM